MNYEMGLHSEIEEKAYEYLFFSRAYLTLAFLGCQEVLSKMEKGSYNNPLGKITPDWVYEFNYILVPALYSLKHAIEMFIKTTGYFLGIPAERKHDIKFLFRKLKGKLQKHSFLKELEELINKYHHNTFLLNKLKEDLELEDKQNDLFRYPDNTIDTSLNFSRILSRFNPDDIKQIQIDIIKLDYFFYEIGFQIMEDKFGPLKVSVPEMKKQFEKIKKNFN